MEEESRRGGAGRSVTLHGPGGARLALETGGAVVGAAPSAAGGAHIRLEAELAGHTWRVAGELLSAAELRALGGWLLLVAAGRLTDPYEPAEPGLSLTGRRHADAVLMRVRLSHDLAPPFPDLGADDPAEGVALRLRLSHSEALEVAALLMAEPPKRPPGRRSA